MWHLLCLTTWFFCFSAQASLSGLAGHYKKSLVFAQVNGVNQYPHASTPAEKCDSSFVRFTQDNELTILIALGYIDFSGGQDFTSSNSSLYHYGDVLDPDAKTAFESALTRGCTTAGKSKNTQTFACGFSKSGNTFSKKIKNRFTGKSMKVRIKLVSSAVSSNDQSNKTTHASEQQRQSQQAHNLFLSGLQTNDVVLYLGHARSGGGPDFYPPQLLKNGHVNYGYYRSTQPGLKSMLGALNGAAGADVIGIFACKSTGLFASSVSKYSPSSALITANQLFDFKDLFPTGFLAVEALVGQRCNENFTYLTESQSQGDLLSFFF